jgi:hypothetical protein
VCLQNPVQDKKAHVNNDHANRTPLLSQNGNSFPSLYNAPLELGTARKMSSGENMSASSKVGKSMEMGYLSPIPGNDASTRSGGNSLADGIIAEPVVSSRNGATKDAKRAATDAPTGDDDDNSKWIHRDKLARIENEELQAAGIILPRARASSRPRGNKSMEKLNAFRKTAPAATATSPTSTDPIDPEAILQPRKNSVTAEQKPQDIMVPSWDLRLPEEIASDANESYWTSNGVAKGVSKIPVAKLSPVPVPSDFLERDSPSVRKQINGLDDTSITYPKTRTRSRSGSMKALEPMTSNTLQPAKRSMTDVSPKKGTGQGARKISAPAKGGAPPGGRPKTRGGPNKDSTSSSGTRPSTRSGELSPGIGGASNKQPEGDPPWMVSAYKPDPRLPPDQQLLPTVARRLQQEKWEKEGKFGNIYDKEFRPLTDEGFLKPPEGEASGVNGDDQMEQDEWPLKTEQRSPTLKQGRSYSTMPKISDKPSASPLPSPSVTQPPHHQNHSQQQITRVPDIPEDQQAQKKGCGCCIVM